ncbi:MFS transporter [Azotosporobacter soli]|uniref:MFS transporter n=1 Tax=Azotosporobacter soli TaxID=3055040 RepID=UPI0031FE83F2
MNELLKAVPKSVWLLGLAHCVADLSPGALYVALPFLKAKFALSYAEVSAIVLVQNIAASITQPLFGYFSDKKHRPWLMPMGCLLTGLFMTASLFAPNYYLVLLCTAISGFGNAAFHPEAAKTVNQLSGVAKGKCISVFSVGGYAGVALGSLLLGSLLLGGESYRLLWYALPSILIFIALLSVMHQFPQMTVRGASTLGTLKEAVSWPLMALLGMILTRATISSGLGTFVPLYYMAYLGGESVYVSSLLTIFLGAGVVGTLIGGTMSDKYGSKKVMLYSTLPIAALLYLFMTAQGASLFLLLALISILLSATATSSMVFAQRMMPKNIGMASGLTLGFSIGLGTMGVTGLGKLADVWGLPLVFEILTVLPLLGFILTMFVREPQRVRN